MAENNGGVTFRVFTPRGCDSGNLNNHSIVSVISYAGSRILVPGDNGPTSWKELFKRDGFLPAIEGTDILVAAHHSQESGYYEGLFDHISPSLTVISDGPEGETSITGVYGQHSSGWQVRNRRSGKFEERKCVTTRCDGVILVKFGSDANGGDFVRCGRLNAASRQS